MQHVTNRYLRNSNPDPARAGRSETSPPPMESPSPHQPRTATPAPTRWRMVRGSRISCSGFTPRKITLVHFHASELRKRKDSRVRLSVAWRIQLVPKIPDPDFREPYMRFTARSYFRRSGHLTHHSTILPQHRRVGRIPSRTIFIDSTISFTILSTGHRGTDRAEASPSLGDQHGVYPLYKQSAWDTCFGEALLSGMMETFCLGRYSICCFFVFCSRFSERGFWKQACACDDHLLHDRSLFALLR